MRSSRMLMALPAPFPLSAAMPRSVFASSPALGDAAAAAAPLLPFLTILLKSATTRYFSSLARFGPRSRRARCSSASWKDDSVWGQKDAPCREVKPPCRALRGLSAPSSISSFCRRMRCTCCMSGTAAAGIILPNSSVSSVFRLRWFVKLEPTPATRRRMFRCSLCSSWFKFEPGSEARLRLTTRDARSKQLSTGMPEKKKLPSSRLQVMPTTPRMALKTMPASGLSCRPTKRLQNMMAVAASSMMVPKMKVCATLWLQNRA
mmetsp:Transcript_14308/g.42905  ORF Transcript_14308/g.42905 Transcript_14308/m.42905 type:complete len:262 (-) Transcript_14308:1121-1906(-)